MTKKRLGSRRCGLLTHQSGHWRQREHRKDLTVLPRQLLEHEALFASEWRRGDMLAHDEQNDDLGHVAGQAAGPSAPSKHCRGRHAQVEQELGQLRTYSATIRGPANAHF